MRNASMLLAMASGFMMAQSIIHEANKEKVQQSIDKYNNAKVYPRKKKKAIRKIAETEYSFWVTISQWQSDILGKCY